SGSKTVGNSPAGSPGLFTPTASPVRAHASHFEEDGYYSTPYLHFTHMQAPKETHVADVDVDPVSGRKIINEYEILDELGRGAHGKVKLGRSLTTSTFVAIKIVERYAKKRRLGKLGNTEDKVKKEVAILKKARHPNIVALLEVIDDPARKKVYIVLEWVQRGEITWRTRCPKALALLEARRYLRHSPEELLDAELHDDLIYVPCLSFAAARVAFRDTVLGIEYLHYQGIIHRDIKPPNLLQTVDHHIKISDFGVSYLGRPIHDDGTDDSETDVQDVKFDEARELAKTVGTAAFYAPELCHTDPDVESPPVTAQIDVWALGVTLFCLIFARTPFVDNEFVIMKNIAEKDVYIPTKRLKPIEPEASSRPSSQVGFTPFLNTKRRQEYERAYEDLDEDLYDLLRRLFIKDPSRRITLTEVKHHPWVLRD
ncbi:kinase-like protein, partial [Viridothelium virens]